MAQQLTFDLPGKPAHGREDYFISPGNALAVEMLEGWPNWPAQKMVLVGARAAGKTHLAQVWATDIGASVTPATRLDQADIPRLAQAPAVIEDVPEIARNTAAQNALFHLHNLMQAGGIPLLLTADCPPAHWHLSLADLQSRMAATGVITLPDPDDALLAAVLQKLFADRQIQVPPSTISYLLKRMDRSFAAASDLVDRLDQAALSRGGPISRKLAALVLDKAPSDAP
ncbi:MAG: chromosomal replication initiator DnaA [Rhodobacterales bacterium]|nr:MAG: chromosomal replication initiator DnaA [Rhodobacterales bacterium]